ncbi:MAG: hypothetical protein LR017_02065, partial [Candidatus Pacebacteria bacterium]|nr:hypothetical protein [Candidatus Paceibacterota bacterium]
YQHFKERIFFVPVQFVQEFQDYRIWIDNIRTDVNKVSLARNVLSVPVDDFTIVRNNKSL